MIINEAELKRLIREAVREELENHRIEPESYLSINQISERLEIGRSSVEKMIREDGLPIIRIGALIRIKNSSLQDWLEKRESVGKL